MSSKKGGASMRYFSEDSAGFRIQPKTVLIMSLIFIGIVVLLHITSKMGAPEKTDGPTAPNDAEPQADQQTTSDEPHNDETL